MKILILHRNSFEYIAKIYWSLEKGFRETADLKTYGHNQEFYDEKITDLSDVIKTCYGNDYPDVILLSFDLKNLRFRYTGVEELPKKVTKVILMGDFWSAQNKKKLVSIVKDKLDYVIPFFRDAFDMYPEIRNQMIWAQPSVDVDMFKDWGLEKKYLVGFLGAGCNEKNGMYPDRHRITQLLKKRYGSSFFTAPHPGWGYFKEDSKLVGAGFSKAINQCKMFVVTSGIIGHCNPKYYEVMASGSLLLAGKCKHMNELNFIQNDKTCVTFDSDSSLLDAIEQYANCDVAPIVENGMNEIKNNHSGRIRAIEIMAKLR